MSDFDKLKDEAEKEALQHPQRVEQGEQDVEKDLGLPRQSQQGQSQQGQSQQRPGSARGGDQGQDSDGQSQQAPASASE
jgi:hypothetical protein